MRLLMIGPTPGEKTLSVLKSAGFCVDILLSLDEAREAVRVSAYAAILLPNAIWSTSSAGWSVKFRNDGFRAPILVRMVRDTVEDRIAAFDLGADDCFPDPIADRELIARLRAVMRRPPLVDHEALVAGNARLDPVTREVWIAERRLRVPRREVSLLEQLMRRFNRVVPRTLIEANLYSWADEVAPNSIEVGVSRIRRRLITAEADVSISTVRGIGYRLHPLSDVGRPLGGADRGA